MDQNNPTHYYLIYDFETGGFDAKKNAAAEIAMIAVRADNFEEIGRISEFIHPYNKKGDNIDYDLNDHLILKIETKDELKKEKQEFNSFIESMYDFTYTEGSKQVHQIPNSDILLGINIKSLVSQIIELANVAKVNNTSGKAILVAHNADFDRNFMQQLFEITGNSKEMPKIFAGKEDYYGNFQPHCIDTIDIARLLWHSNEDEIANYKQSTCIQKAGLDLVGAHKAINDTLGLKDLLLYFKKCIRSSQNNTLQSEEKRFRDDFKISFEY